MVSWSLKRRITYTGGVLSIVALILGWFLFITYYEPPSCFDGEKNGGEQGIDCSGACKYLCPFQVAEPVVIFSRSFKVTPGVYNAIAYVENPNYNIGSDSIGYTFTLFDGDGNEIARRNGKTFISVGYISPIFEGGITTGGSIPTRTFFELEDRSERWTRVDEVTESPLIVKNKTLRDVDTLPRVSASLENTSVNEYHDVEVVVVVFDALKNAIATSRTIVDVLPRKGSIPLDFTWPQPFTKKLEACVVPVDTMLLIDTSGSMNDDGDDPPQPITDAKNAASDFIGRLSDDDRAGLITFATHSTVIERFTNTHEITRSKVSAVTIPPLEEKGFTNMGDAIRDSIEVLETDSGGSKKNQSVLIILTDGIANAPIDPGGEPHALSYAENAKAAGYTIYTIGLGDNVNNSFLEEIGSNEDSDGEEYSYFAATSKDLTGIYAQISDSICERGGAIIDVIPRIPQ